MLDFVAMGLLFSGSMAKWRFVASSYEKCAGVCGEMSLENVGPVFRQIASEAQCTCNVGSFKPYAAYAVKRVRTFCPYLSFR